MVIAYLKEKVVGEVPYGVEKLHALVSLPKTLHDYSLLC
jgi:hypothetical protein